MAQRLGSLTSPQMSPFQVSYHLLHWFLSESDDMLLSRLARFQCVARACRLLLGHSLSNMARHVLARPPLTLTTLRLSTHYSSSVIQSSRRVTNEASLLYPAKSHEQVARWCAESWLFQRKCPTVSAKECFRKTLPKLQGKKSHDSCGWPPIISMMSLEQTSWVSSECRSRVPISTAAEISQLKPGKGRDALVPPVTCHWPTATLEYASEVATWGSRLILIYTTSSLSNRQPRAVDTKYQ